MTANDDLLDAQLRHAVGVRRLERRLVLDVLDILDEADKVVVKRLTAAAKRLPPDSWTVRHMKRQLKGIRAATIAGWEKAGKQLTMSLKDLAVQEASFQVEMVKGVLPTGVAFEVPNEKLLRAVTDQKLRLVKGDQIVTRVFTSEVKKQTARKLKRIDGTVKLGVLTGQSNQQITREVMRTAQLSRREAATLTRTVTNHTLNQAQSLTYQRNEDVISSLEWSAHLDHRTSPICMRRHGKRFVNNGRHPRPPAHFNCRSVLVPITKSWEELGIDIDYTPAQKKYLGGDPAKHVDAASWLRRQSPDFQKSILGKRKAEIFRANPKSSMDQFIDVKGRPYTLRELARFDRSHLKIPKSLTDDPLLRFVDSTQTSRAGLARMLGNATPDDGMALLNKIESSSPGRVSLDDVGATIRLPGEQHAHPYQIIRELKKGDTEKYSKVGNLKNRRRLYTTDAAAGEVAEKFAEENWTVDRGDLKDALYRSAVRELDDHELPEAVIAGGELWLIPSKRTASLAADSILGRNRRLKVYSWDDYLAGGNSPNSLLKTNEIFEDLGSRPLADGKSLKELNVALQQPKRGALDEYSEAGVWRWMRENDFSQSEAAIVIEDAIGVKPSSSTLMNLENSKGSIPKLDEAQKYHLRIMAGKRGLTGIASEDGKKIFGKSRTSVLRWLGAEGYTRQEARGLFNSLGIDVNENTINKQMRYGRQGHEKFPPAVLTDDQAEVFRFFGGKPKSSTVPASPVLPRPAAPSIPEIPDPPDAKIVPGKGFGRKRRHIEKDEFIARMKQERIINEFPEEWKDLDSATKNKLLNRFQEWRSETPTDRMLADIWKEFDKHGMAHTLLDPDGPFKDLKYSFQDWGGAGRHSPWFNDSAGKRVGWVTRTGTLGSPHDKFRQVGVFAHEFGHAIDALLFKGDLPGLTHSMYGWDDAFDVYDHASFPGWMKKAGFTETDFEKLKNLWLNAAHEFRNKSAQIEKAIRKEKAKSLFFKKEMTGKQFGGFGQYTRYNKHETSVSPTTFMKNLHSARHSISLDRLAVSDYGASQWVEHIPESIAIYLGDVRPSGGGISREEFKEFFPEMYSAIDFIIRILSRT